MFTGIIEETGKILHIGPDRLHIQAKKVLEGTKTGDSIAVNGVCLTVIKLDGRGFTADVMPETFSRSALGSLPTGSSVNLERAMAADGRFGGHIVSGHIDGTGTIKTMTKDGNAIRCQISAPGEILRGIVVKGSVAIDGISLTVAGVWKDRFEVSVIPHTLSETILTEKRPGDLVNLETDIIGKYVERLLLFEKGDSSADSAGASGSDSKKTGLTKEFLLRSGF